MKKKCKAMKCTKGKNKCAVIDNYNLFRRENNTSYWKGLLEKTVERKGETFALKSFLCLLFTILTSSS